MYQTNAHQYKVFEQQKPIKLGYKITVNVVVKGISKRIEQEAFEANLVEIGFVTAYSGKDAIRVAKVTYPKVKAPIVECIKHSNEEYQDFLEMMHDYQENTYGN